MLARTLDGVLRRAVALAVALGIIAVVERELWRWRDRRSHYRADLYRERVAHAAEREQLRTVIALAPYARRRRPPAPPVTTLWPAPTRRELRR